MRSLLACRVDGQSLLEAIERIETAGNETDPELRAAAVKVAVVDAAAVYRCRQLTEHVHQIRTAQAACPRIGEEIGDALQTVENCVEDLKGSWPRTAEQPDQAIAYATKAKRILVTLTTEAAKLTIPERLKDHLEQRATGRPVDFHEVFADELPDAAVRREFLAELKEYEVKSFNGVVDVEAGVIYVASPSRRIRNLTIAAPAIFAVLVGALLFAISKLNVGWALQDADHLVLGYVLALMGMVVHLLVENVKQLDMAGKIVVVGDKLTWMHLHWVALCMSIVPVAITTVGLIFIGVDDGEWWVTFLAAGYASDSIAGLFLTRYDTLAQGTIEKLTKRIKKPATTSAG